MQNHTGLKNFALYKRTLQSSLPDERRWLVAEIEFLLRTKVHNMKEEE